MARRWRSGSAASAWASAAAWSRACRRRSGPGRLVGDLGHGVAAELAAGLAPAAQPVDAEVRRHAVEPGGERRAVGLPVGGDLPEPQHRLLRHVLGLRHLAQHPPRQREDARRVPGGERPRGRLVPLGIAREEGGVGRLGRGLERGAGAGPHRADYGPSSAPPSPADSAARAREGGRAPRPSLVVLRRGAVGAAVAGPARPVTHAARWPRPSGRGGGRAWRRPRPGRSRRRGRCRRRRAGSSPAGRRSRRCVTWPASVAPMTASTRSAKASAGSGPKRSSRPPRGPGIASTSSARLSVPSPLASALASRSVARADELGAAERAVAVGVDGDEVDAAGAEAHHRSSGRRRAGRPGRRPCRRRRCREERGGGGDRGDACHEASFPCLVFGRSNARRRRLRRAPRSRARDPAAPVGVYGRFGAGGVRSRP